VGCIDGIHFIAQEYVAGQNLKQLLLRRGPVEPIAAVSIIRQVSAALQRAGQRGVVHRDIKPENILIAPGGEVKVADFGLARASNQSLELTQVGITMGTPLYMSPEQVEGGVIDPRTDIYSFGVTCYQMLAGRPPFDGDSPLAVAVQHLRKAPERLENLRPDIPQGLCRIIHKMLAKVPGDRYQTAGEILRDLRELRLEGDDAQWTALLEEASPDWATRTDARMEATQQLDALMKTSARASLARPQLRPALLGLAAAFVIGAAAAWMLRPAPLLHYDRSELPPVVKLANGQAQFLYAEEIKTESAYRSVELHFPEDARYVNLARRRLAKLYLREGDLDAALTAYTQLANLPETEAQYRAIGLAGQLAVFIRRNEMVKAVAKHRELQPLLPELTDNELKEIADRFARTQEASAAGNPRPFLGAE
jgi:serine/threonine-protein kinase